MADQFATVDQLASYLRMTIPSDDPMAILALQGATKSVQDYTRQQLSLVEDDVAYIDGSGSDTVLLPEIPVPLVSEVIVDIDTSNPQTLLDRSNGDASEFDWIEEAGLLIRRRGQFVLWESRFTATFGLWPGRRRSIKVTYTHGFEEIPVDVQIVVIAAAARTWAQDGATSETTGSYTVAYAGQPGMLTKDEMRTLDRYRTRRK